MLAVTSIRQGGLPRLEPDRAAAVSSEVSLFRLKGQGSSLLLAGPLDGAGVTRSSCMIRYLYAGAAQKDRNHQVEHDRTTVPYMVTVMLPSHDTVHGRVGGRLQS